MNRTFIISDNIMQEHKVLPIKQIYLWLVTKDFKMPIVAGKSGNFQFPGGKPEEGESFFDTLEREMFEETGLEIDTSKDTPILFGYYLIEDDSNWPDTPKYLQLRFFLRIDNDSSELTLGNNEIADGKDNMISAKFADVFNLQNDIPWVKGIEEYTRALELVEKAS